MKSSWFKKNPSKTLFLFFIFVIICLAFITEKILVLKTKTARSGIFRYIRLREHEPSRREFLTPDNNYNLPSKKYLFRTDKNGFILPSKIHDNPDISIVFLGGSGVECAYVDEESRFPYLVGRLIENNIGIKVNSYNSGVGGNNSLHSLDILLNKLIPMNPDVAVMMHNFNDLNILLVVGDYWNEHTCRSPIAELKLLSVDTLKIIKNSTFPNLYREINKIFIRDKLSPDEFQSRRGQKININKTILINEFKMNLQMFINICRTRDIIPILMTMPSRLKHNPDATIINLMKTMEKDYGIGYEAYKEIFDLFNESIREVGAKNNVLVIDLAKKIPQEKEYMYDIMHFNTNGSKYAAIIIDKSMEPLIISVSRKKKNREGLH